MDNNWYAGTDLKFLVEMSSTGFNMDTDDWSISVKNANKVVLEIPKSQCVREAAEGKWYVHINADILKPGTLSLVAHIRVPDVNFEDGYRDEYEERSVGTIKKI